MRARSTTPIVATRVASSHGVKLGVIDLPTFDVPGIHAEVAQALEALLARSTSRGSCSTCATTAAGLVTEAQLVASMFIAPRRDRHDARARAAAARCTRPAHPIAPTIPLVVLVNARHRVGGGDRHRRAAGPPSRGRRRHPHLRQGRLPGDPPALQRRRDRHHRRRSTTCPNGENLGAGGAARAARGIKPNVRSTPAADRATATRSSQAALARARGASAVEPRRAAPSRRCSSGAAASSSRASCLSADAGAARPPTVDPARSRREGRRPRARRDARRRGAAAAPRSCAGSGVRTSPAT